MVFYVGFTTSLGRVDNKEFYATLEATPNEYDMFDANAWLRLW